MVKEYSIPLKSLLNNKAPGSVFLSKFWSDIELFDSFAQSFKNKELLIDQIKAAITFLPKSGKALRYLKNWHTLSLLNTDNKMLSNLGINSAAKSHL